MADQADDRSKDEKPQSARRRKWETPRLTAYGHIGKLTQGTSGTKTESTVFKSCL